MAINKVIYGDTTLIDLTSDTATAADVAVGKFFHGADGVRREGTNSGGITPAGNIELTQQTGTDVTDYATASVRSGAMSVSTSVSASGLITSSASVSAAGWLGAGTRTATRQLSTRSAATITPTESSQTAIQSGYFATGTVTVAPIPANYGDVTKSDVTDADVLAGKLALFDNDGIAELREGTMPDNTGWSETIDAQDTTATIPRGFHDGNTHVNVVPEDKSITPGADVQEVTPSAGKVLRKVTVAGVASEELNVAANGTYTPPSGKLYSKVNVDVPEGIWQYTIYPATTAPSAAQEGDIWIDYSQEITGLPDVITAGEQPVLMSDVQDAYVEKTTTMTATGVKITIPKAGTYRFKIYAKDGYTSSSSHGSVQLYKNRAAISGATVTWTTHGGSYYTTTGYKSVDVSCAAGDELELYARSYNTSSGYGVVASLLIACINWNIWGN